MIGKMDDTCESNTTAPTKEATKFENLNDEMGRTPGYITEIFQTVSNIEDRLGEGRDKCETDCEKQQDPTSIIEKATMKSRNINNDLIAIKDRLKLIQNLF